MDKNSITIADVAQRAGVSKTTVSHALSGKRPVAIETRKRIEKIIEELGFRPNLLARGLRMQRTQLIALIIPDILNPFYPMLARGLQQAFHAHNYGVMLCITDDQHHMERLFITEAVHRKVDGIVFCSHFDRRQDVQIIIEKHIPLVALGPCVEHPDIDMVHSNDGQGAYNAVHYLLNRYNQHIAIIGGPQKQLPALTRLTGYQQALQEAGIPLQDKLIIEGDFTRAGGAKATKLLLERFSDQKNYPRAIFCVNDLTAIGALDTLHAYNLTVPDDIAIVGYDDIEAASLVSPALTTIVNPAYEMGQATGELLLERLRGSYQGPGRRIILPHRFVKRVSA